MKASCPACSAEVHWYLSAIIWIPYPIERDLRGPETREDFVTCERCLYTDTSADFQRSLTPQTLEKFQLAKLELPLDVNLEQNRYSSIYLARAGGRLRSDSSEKQAFVSMNLAWSLRASSEIIDQRVGMLSYGILKDDYPFSFDHPPDPEQEWRRMEVDFITTKDPERRHALSVALARKLSFLGEYDYLLQLLPQLEGLPSETADRVRALRDQERTLALEPALADALLAVEDPRTEKPAEMVYLVAELHRRLEHHDLAREWYNKALARPDLEPQIRQWIPEQIQLLDGPKKPYSPLLPAIALAGLLTLLGWKQRSRNR